jgi:hypothetical protein
MTNREKSLSFIAVIGALIFFIGSSTSAQSATTSNQEIESLKKSVASLTASLKAANKSISILSSNDLALQSRLQGLESKGGGTSTSAIKEGQITFVATPNIFGECPSGYRADLFAERFYVSSRTRDFGTFDSSKALIECTMKVLTK